MMIPEKQQQTSKGRKMYLSHTQMKLSKIETGRKGRNKSGGKTKESMEKCVAFLKNCAVAWHTQTHTLYKRRKMACKVKILVHTGHVCNTQLFYSLDATIKTKENAVPFGMNI